MNLLQLRNIIESEGGVLNALDDGYRDEDIDDDEMSEMWYEIQIQFDNLVGDIAEFESRLQDRINEEPEEL